MKNKLRNILHHIFFSNPILNKKVHLGNFLN